MAIELPEKLTSVRAKEGQELTPQDIVSELDKYVIGQEKAKKAVAIALRNRLRRRKLPKELADEVAPKNIIMIGPTGVGKTEIARRLSALTRSPFIKVEATRFTEVGYKGRDVESMVRDLLGIAIDIVKQEQIERVAAEAKRIAEDRLLDILLPKQSDGSVLPDQSGDRDTFHQTREKLRHRLRAGELNDRLIDLEIPDRRSPSFEIITSSGIEEMGIQMQDMLTDMFPGRTRKKAMRVDEAIEHLTKQEQMKLIDMEEVGEQAVELVENSGIIFLDEIDKIVGNGAGHGPDVSREGVQRDILPIIEGTTVQTKYGLVRTDHILFIAAGAFHSTRPSDLIPELQGRFPIRVELESLNREDFIKILQDPKNALVTQYRALLATEGIELQFTPDAIEEIAEFATQVNQNTENIGARRLHTVMEKLLEEISFHAPNLDEKAQLIDADYVRDMLSEIATDQDLSRYIL